MNRDSTLEYKVWIEKKSAKAQSHCFCWCENTMNIASNKYIEKLEKVNGFYFTMIEYVLEVTEKY